MQRNICQICGKDMSESGEVLYSRIYDTPVINEGRYIQRIGCCDNCGFVTVLNPLGDTEMAKHYSSGYDYTNYSSLEIEKDNYIEGANKAMKLFESLRLEYDSVKDSGEERQTHIHDIIGSHGFLDNYFGWSRSTSTEILDKLKKIIHSDDSVAIWGASFQTERLLGENDYSWMNLECILDNSDLSKFPERLN